MNNKDDLIEFDSPKLLKPSNAVKYSKSFLGINEENEQNCLNTGNSLVHLDNTFNMIECTEKSMIDGKNIEEKLQPSNIVNISAETCNTTIDCSSVPAVHNNSTVETEQHFELSSLKNNSSIIVSDIIAIINNSIQEAIGSDKAFTAKEINLDSEAINSKDLDIKITSEESETSKSVFVSHKAGKENIMNKEVDSKILFNPLNSPSKLNFTEAQCHSTKKEVINTTLTEEINSLKELLVKLGNENKKLQDNNLKYVQELEQKSELLLKQTTFGQNLERGNKNLIQENQNLTEQKQNLTQELQTFLDENKEINSKKHILIGEDEKLLDDRITLERSIHKLKKEVLSQDLKIQQQIEENEKLEKNYGKLCHDSQLLLEEVEKINEENKQLITKTGCKEMDYQQQHQNLCDKLEAEKVNAEKYRIVLRDYEEYFNGLNEVYKKLQVQNKRKTYDLVVLETAFRNTVEKYEKCKILVDGYLTNEVIYQRNVKKLKDKLIEEQKRLNALKEVAIQQFQGANMDFAYRQNKCEEVSKKQYANEKQLETELCSLGERLQQKKVECERLAKLYDEFEAGNI